jgi:prepilin-type N-terminal cleavage/methylation domain-containing protein
MKVPHEPTPYPMTQRAFTLVELIIVLAVVGVLAGIAVPRYANFLTRRRVEAAANRIIVDLALAQRQARLTGTSQEVKFDITRNTYRLANFADPDHAGVAYEAALWDQPYQTSIISAEFDGDAILAFDAYGAPDSGGTVVVRAGDRQITINVDAFTGRASVTGFQVVPGAIIDPKPIDPHLPKPPVEAT